METSELLTPLASEERYRSVSNRSRKARFKLYKVPFQRKATLAAGIFCLCLLIAFSCLCGSSEADTGSYANLSPLLAIAVASDGARFTANSDGVAFSVSKGQKLTPLTIEKEEKDKNAYFYKWGEVVLMINLSTGVPVFELDGEVLPMQSRPELNRQNILGTDAAGQDMLRLLAFSMRASLLVSALAACAALFLGCLTGSIGALLKMSAFARSAASFPLALYGAFVCVLGGGSFGVRIIAASLIAWPAVAGAFASDLNDTYSSGYMAAARAMGGGRARLFFAHGLPSAFQAAFRRAARALPRVFAAEAFLGFLCVNESGAASIGSLMRDGALNAANCPWLAIEPSVLACLALFGLACCGDAFWPQAKGGEM